MELTCKQCLKKFMAKGFSAKYCPACRPEIIKERRRNKANKAFQNDESSIMFIARTALEKGMSYGQYVAKYLK